MQRFSHKLWKREPAKTEFSGIVYTANAQFSITLLSAPTFLRLIVLQFALIQKGLPNKGGKGEMTLGYLHI